MTFDLLLQGGEIVHPGVGVARGSIGVRDGLIVALLAPGERASAREVIDCRNAFVLPGLIDPHTHFGFGDPLTDFRTEARSAVLGGVTAAMTFHRSADLRASTPEWRDRGTAQSCIDFGFHYGLTSRLHVDTLEDCARRFGVTSFKFYLMYKGAAGAAKGFHEIDDALLFAAMQATARIPGAVLGAHCENVEVIPALRPALQAAGRDDLAAWDAQSPDFLEAENVFRVGYFGEKTGCPVNIVHLSSAEGLGVVDMLRARPRPAPIHVETCTHYLLMTRDWASPVGKVNPPLRGAGDVEALWQGIADGRITTVGSDHVPRKLATKGPDLWRASAGFPGIATLLPILMEEGWHRRGLPIETLAAVTSLNVARLYNLPRKGRIAVGHDADFAVVDPDASRRVTAGALESFSDYTPYEGLELRGWPRVTIRRGRVLQRDGVLLPDVEGDPGGEYLFRAVPAAAQEETA